MNIGVKKVYDSYPENVNKKLQILRKLIYQVAQEIKVTWDIQETLKWWEPSYITSQNTGTTIRLALVKWTQNKFGIFFNCKSSMITSIKEVFWDQFEYQGNRALIFSTQDVLNFNNIKYCFELALTYHLKK